jgi:peptide/nickel transport system permease protein
LSSATTTQSGYVAAPTLADVLPPVKQRGRAATFVRRNPTIVVGGTLLLIMVLIAIFAPYLGTVDPTALAPAKRTRAPSAQFWFGSDMLGRDVYSRVIYGGRISLIVGFAVAAVA